MCFHSDLYAIKIYSLLILYQKCELMNGIHLDLDGVLDQLIKHGKPNNQPQQLISFIRNEAERFLYRKFCVLLLARIGPF